MKKQITDGGALQASAGSREGLYRLIDARNAKRRRHRNLAISLISIFIFAMFTFFLMASIAFGSRSEIPAANQKIAQVKRAGFEEGIDASGKLVASKKVDISSSVTGVVNEVFVKVGDFVEEGDPLFTLTNFELESAASESLESLEEARKYKENVSSQYDEASHIFEKRVSDYEQAVKDYNQQIASLGDDVEAKEAISAPVPFDVDSASSSLSSMKTIVEAAQQAVDQAQIVYDSALQRIRQCEVDATCSGTVTSVQVEEGGSLYTVAAPAVQITDLNELSVTCIVDESDIVNIYQDQACSIEIDSLPEIKISGIVDGISYFPDDNAQSESGGVGYVVTLNISEADFDGVIKPGMTANVKIITNRIEDALVVPSSSVGRDEEGQYLLISAGDGFFKRCDIDVIGDNGVEIAFNGEAIQDDEVSLDPGSIRDEYIIS